MNRGKTALLVVLSCLVVGACNKPLPDYSSQPFGYSVSYASDVSVAANDHTLLSPTIALVSGDASANPVTLTFNGLPANVYLAKNNFSFRLNTNISDSLGAANAAQGSYPIQAVFSSPAGTKTLNFNLTITAPVNRVANVMGYFYPSNSCWNNIYVSCEIDSVPGVPNGIMIIDRTSPNESSYGTFDTTYATVDCCTNTFVIPSQKVHGATVTGYGSTTTDDYPYKEGKITRTIVTDTATYNCTVTLGQN